MEAGATKNATTLFYNVKSWYTLFKVKLWLIWL